MRPIVGCEECELAVELGCDEACIECQLYEQPVEELTPEGIQLVIPGAEKSLEPTETDKQGRLW